MASNSYLVKREAYLVSKDRCKGAEVQRDVVYFDLYIRYLVSDISSKSGTISKYKCLNFITTSWREKSRPSIIRDTCTFDTKIREFYDERTSVSTYEEKNKNFFRKI